MTVKLTLIRGVPGSGKSTIAKQISAATRASHFEADMFFDLAQIEYDSALVSAAHKWCFGNTAIALLTGTSVVVANTFVRMWEMEEYIRFAQHEGFPVDIIHCVGNFQNIHGVSSDKVHKMRSTFQSNESIREKFDWPNYFGYKNEPNE